MLGYDIFIDDKLRPHLIGDYADLVVKMMLDIQINVIRAFNFVYNNIHFGLPSIGAQIAK